MWVELPGRVDLGHWPSATLWPDPGETPYLGPMPTGTSAPQDFCNDMYTLLVRKETTRRGVSGRPLTGQCQSVIGK